MILPRIHKVVFPRNSGCQLLCQCTAEPKVSIGIVIYKKQETVKVVSSKQHAASVFKSPAPGENNESFSTTNPDLKRIVWNLTKITNQSANMNFHFLISFYCFLMTSYQLTLLNDVRSCIWNSFPPKSLYAKFQNALKLNKSNALKKRCGQCCVGSNTYILPHMFHSLTYLNQ